MAGTLARLAVRLYVPAQRIPAATSHAIPAMIRLAPQQVEEESERSGLIARILAWIGNLLSRR